MRRRERWMEVQIVSDMLISSLSLTAKTIKVTGHEFLPLSRSSSFLIPVFFPPRWSCREPFQAVAEIKEMTSLDKLPHLIISLKRNTVLVSVWQTLGGVRGHV